MPVINERMVAYAYHEETNAQMKSVMLLAAIDGVTGDAGTIYVDDTLIGRIALALGRYLFNRGRYTRPAIKALLESGCAACGVRVVFDTSQEDEAQRAETADSDREVSA